jgi:hypothetical protein
MKRNLITILSLVVMSLMFNATGAYAQSYVKADVPFAFNAGAAQLPAGTYEIKVSRPGANEIMIQNGDNRAVALSNARREGPRKTESKLVFHRIANQYFLAEVWKGSGEGGLIVPTSKHEKDLMKELRLAKDSSGVHEEAIAALK